MRFRLGVVGALIAAQLWLASAPLLAQEEKSEAGLSFSERIQAIQSAKPNSGETAAPQGEASGPSAGKLIQGLGLCLGLFFIVVHFLKRSQRFQKVGGGGARLKLIERMPISGKAALVLVEIDGQKMVLGVGSEQVSFAHAPHPFKMKPPAFAQVESAAKASGGTK